MNLLNLFNISSIICFIVGSFFGALVYRLTFSSEIRNRTLKKDLEEANQKLKSYKKNVSDHMVTSAELFKNLSVSNQAIRQHFMHTFQELCDDEKTYYQLVNSLKKNANHEAYINNNQETMYEQPKDYVPKESTDGQGVLSEGFGLQDKEANEK